MTLTSADTIVAGLRQAERDELTAENAKLRKLARRAAKWVDGAGDRFQQMGHPKVAVEAFYLHDLLASAGEEKP